MMSYSNRSRYSRSPSPNRRYGRSISRSLSRSRSMSRSRSRSRDASVENPGNNLYVTGLSARITKRDLEKHFSTEGKVEDVHLVVDPLTRESRGFGFVTMSTVEEADCCIKYLNQSILEGRVITVEKARRRRGRTPTPGRYLGLKTVHARHRSPSYSPYYRSRSSRYSSERDRSRSQSPYYSSRRSYSPYHGRRRSYSPRYSRGRFYSRSRSPYSRSPVNRRERSYSPYDSRYYSPDGRYYRRSRYHSVSRSISPRVRRSSRRSYSRSVSPRRSRRSYSRSISPNYKRSSRRSYYRSITPDYKRSSRRSYSRSISPRTRKSSKICTSRVSSRGCEDSQDSYYSRSRSGSPYSGSVSPRSDSPSH